MYPGSPFIPTDVEGIVLKSFSQSAVRDEQIYDPYGNQRYTSEIHESS